jgi:SAM-dependent methyltransferase
VSPAFYQSLGLSELLPRYAYLQALIADARVLELGAVSSTGGRAASELRELGARSVLAVDADPELVARAHRSYCSDPELRFRAASVDQLLDETFDLVLVADLAPYLRDARGLDALSRLLGPEGRLAAGLRNPAGASLARLAVEEDGLSPPTYGQMLVALRERFGAVEVATQSALVGYALAPLSPGAELELAVDGSFVEAEECAYFLALCGQAPTGALSEHALIALPAAPLAVAADQRWELSQRLRQVEAEREKARAELAPSQRAHAELERSLGRARDELALEQARAEEERARSRRAEERADRLEREGRAASSGEGETGRLRETIGALGRRVDSAEAERDALAKRLDAELARARALDETSAQRAVAEAETRTEIESLKTALADARTAAARSLQIAEALEEARARAGRLERDVETVSGLEHSARARADQAEVELAEARGRIAELEEEARILERSLAEAEGHRPSPEPAPAAAERGGTG